MGVLFVGRQKKSWSIFLSIALRFRAYGLPYFLYHKVAESVPTWLKSCVEKHDIHIKSKSYKLELLGELVI